MHRAVVLLLALGFGSAFLSAQSASSNEPQVVVQKSSIAPDGSTVWTTLGQKDAQALLHRDGQAVILRDSASVGCPVSLIARQSSAAFARQVRGSEPPANGDLKTKDVAQKLHLSAIGPDSKRIVAASVIVHGYSNKVRRMPVDSTNNNYDASKILNVRFSPDSDKADSADIAVPGLTAVSEIDLNAVTYVDGSTWKVEGNQSCRTWVDGLMLVSGR